MTFSLRTLLEAVTVLAVTLVGSQKLHSLYCLRELDRCVENGDGCSIIELLHYSEDQDFPRHWADGTWVRAAKRGDYYTLKHFSRHHDVNRKIEGHKTALMLVVENGHFNAAKFLLVLNADTTIRNADGETAFDIATRMNQPEIATLISASQSDSWNRILRAERLIEALRHDSVQTRMHIDELLSKKEYAELAASRIQIPHARDKTYWFHADERISIGLASSSYDFTWMVEGVPIEDVESFDPR